MRREKFARFEVSITKLTFLVIYGKLPLTLAINPVFRLIIASFALGLVLFSMPAFASRPAAEVSSGFVSLRGPEVAKKAAAAKLTLVNLWATWCAPCVEELPELLKLDRKYAPSGFQLLLINANTPNEEAEVRTFIAKMQVQSPLYRMGEPPDRFMRPLLPKWSMTLPVTVLLDHSGKVLASWVGRLPIPDAEAKIKKHLGNSRMNAPRSGPSAQNSLSLPART